MEASKIGIIGLGLAVILAAEEERVIIHSFIKPILVL
jgi:hypothetical protein